jgi:dTMP kinase
VSSAPRGFFVTFEGGEGCGKSTQLELLAGVLGDVAKMREPGSSPGAQTIRRLLTEGEPDRWDALTETLLLSAARRDFVERTLRPHLDGGGKVLCDRFTDSTVAYQGYGGGVDLAFIATLNKAVTGGIVPDLTLVLDLPVETGLARAMARAGAETRFERKGPSFHARVREGFLAVAKAEPQRCVVIDASGTIDEVRHRIRTAVTQRLGIEFDGR